MFYATEIYYQTGMDDTQVAYSTVGTGAINVLMTIVAVSITMFLISSPPPPPPLLLLLLNLFVCFVGSLFATKKSFFSRRKLQKRSTFDRLINIVQRLH